VNSVVSFVLIADDIVGILYPELARVVISSLVRCNLQYHVMFNGASPAADVDAALGVYNCNCLTTYQRIYK